MTTGILLINPKYDHNVAAAIRSCHVFGADSLRWTGDRVPASARLPREERMRAYRSISWMPMRTDEPGATRPLQVFTREGMIPVAVEVRDRAEELDTFVHPEDAVYVFGPEDGSLGRGILSSCHRFVRIPTATRTPLNLGAAVNVILYDRYVKTRREVAATS